MQRLWKKNMVQKRSLTTYQSAPLQENKRNHLATAAQQDFRLQSLALVALDVQLEDYGVGGDGLQDLQHGDSLQSWQGSVPALRHQAFLAVHDDAALVLRVVFHRVQGVVGVTVTGLSFSCL